MWVIFAAYAIIGFLAGVVVAAFYDDSDDEIELPLLTMIAWPFFAAGGVLCGISRVMKYCGKKLRALFGRKNNHAQNDHGVWKYCLHPKAACSVIHFEYQQQRRPEWCPLEEEHDGHQGN